MTSLRVIFDQSVVDETHLSLARWVSDYYLCSLFDAVAPMLPPGSRVQTRTVVSLSEEISDLEAVANSDRQLRVISAVKRDGEADVDSLASSMGEWVRQTIGPLVSRGLLERSYRSNRRMIGPRYVEFLRVRTSRLAEIRKWLSEQGTRAPRQADLIRSLVESDSLTPATQARREFGSSVVSALRDKGICSGRADTGVSRSISGQGIPAPAQGLISPDLSRTRSGRLKKC